MKPDENFSNIDNCPDAKDELIRSLETAGLKFKAIFVYKFNFLQATSYTSNRLIFQMETANSVSNIKTELSKTIYDDNQKCYFYTLTKNDRKSISKGLFTCDEI